MRDNFCLYLSFFHPAGNKVTQKKENWAGDEQNVSFPASDTCWEWEWGNILEMMATNPYGGNPKNPRKIKRAKPI